MSNVPEFEERFVWDLLDGKSEVDAQFHRERATREVQQDIHAKMDAYGLHPLEYIEVAREAYAREKEDWKDVAGADLLQGTEDVADILHSLTGVVHHPSGEHKVSIVELLADVENLGVALEQIRDAYNGYLRQHFRLPEEMAISIALNVLDDHRQTVSVEHTDWCIPSQCHVYDGGATAVHRREYYDKDLRLFTVSQCDTEDKPVIPDLDAGDFLIEDLLPLARTLMHAYADLTGANPIADLMEEWNK